MIPYWRCRLSLHRWVAGPIEQKVDGRCVSWTEKCRACPKTRHVTVWDETNA